MTILFAGGEDTGFSPIIGASGGASVDQGSTYSGQTVRAAFCRCVLAVFNATSIADPPPSRWQTPPFTAGNLVWLHAQLSIGTGGAGPSFANTANAQAFLLRSPDGVSRIALRATGTTGQLKVSTRNAVGAFVDLATATANLSGPAAPTQLDLRIDYSATGGVQMWYNGAQVVNYVGDPRTDAATQLNQIELAAINNLGSANAGTGWSEVIVADTDTRSMALWTLAPAAAGNTQSWTPNTLGNINKVAISDSTFVSAAANNALSEWTTPTAAPAGVWAVQALVQNARAQVSSTGPQHFDWLVRTAAIDYLASAPQAPPLAAFANFAHIWPVNPNTGLAWTVADITAAGFNLGIESQA
jgi:hypothetical protein